MHHLENNATTDYTSTLHYQRDNPLHFLIYYCRFFFFGPLLTAKYHVLHRHLYLAAELLLHEVFLLLFLIGLFLFNSKAAVFVILIPYLWTRFMLITGNWAQHAFVDLQDPDNVYRNTVICLNTGINEHCFNEGYHLIHHLTPQRHWSQMPLDFVLKSRSFEKAGTLVFNHLDYFNIWLNLMTGRIDRLAAHVVQLGDHPLDRKNLIDLLRERVRRASKQKGHTHHA